MRRLHLLVEGQTEEILCNRLFIPHLETNGWATVTTSILSTKRAASGAKFRGGVSGWDRIRREIERLLPSFDLVTTMIDYYGLPEGTPGMGSRPSGGAYERLRHVENAIATVVGDRRFLPHLTLHETEAWVFAAADAVGQLFDDPVVADDLRKMAQEAGGPELINDDPEAAPSKRLLRRLPRFVKTVHGPLSIEGVGLASLREQCPHLGSWLSALEQRAL